VRLGGGARARLQAHLRDQREHRAFAAHQRPAVRPQRDPWTASGKHLRRLRTLPAMAFAYQPGGSAKQHVLSDLLRRLPRPCAPSTGAAPVCNKYGCTPPPPPPPNNLQSPQLQSLHVQARSWRSPTTRIRAGDFGNKQLELSPPSRGDWNGDGQGGTSRGFGGTGHLRVPEQRQRYLRALVRRQSRLGLRRQ